MNNISFILAFSAGLLSFLSPCVLPLIPAYVSYLTGLAVSEINTNKAKLTVIYKSIGFIIGFSIVFIIMGASISTLGKFFTVNQSLLRKIGGILILVFGLHTTGLFKIKALYAEKRLLPFGSERSVRPIVAASSCFQMAGLPSARSCISTSVSSSET